MAENDKSLLWDEYKLQVETYRFYLDLVIKINLFFYAITGGILSFYFTKKSIPEVEYALILPLIMSILLLAFFLFGAIANKNSQMQVEKISDKLGFDVYPAVITLTYLLYGCAVLMGLVATSLTVVLCCPGI